MSKKPLVHALLLIAALSPASAALANTPDPAAAERDFSTPLYGWIRFDVDAYGLQIWAGATHDLGPFAIASNIWMGEDATSGNPIGEFDIGPEFRIGSLTIVPKFGVGFDFRAGKLDYLNMPQLYVTLDTSALYIDSWSQLFLYDVVTEPAADKPPKVDIYYTRNCVLFYVARKLAIGVQAELTLAVDNAEANGLDVLVSLPVGGRVDIAYGAGGRFSGFIGYETQTPYGNTNKLAGRLTYTHVFF